MIKFAIVECGGVIKCSTIESGLLNSIINDILQNNYSNFIIKNNLIYILYSESKLLDLLHSIVDLNSFDLTEINKLLSNHIKLNLESKNITLENKNIINGNNKKNKNKKNKDSFALDYSNSTAKNIEFKVYLV